MDFYMTVYYTTSKKSVFLTLTIAQIISMIPSQSPVIDCQLFHIQKTYTDRE